MEVITKVPVLLSAKLLDLAVKMTKNSTSLIIAPGRAIFY